MIHREKQVRCLLFFLLSAYEVSNLYDNSGFDKEKQISYHGKDRGVLVGGSVPELLTQRLWKSERPVKDTLAPIMAG